MTPPGQARDFAGTPTYCSLNLNRGGEPSPADDVEGLVTGSIFNYINQIDSSVGICAFVAFQSRRTSLGT